MMGRRDRMVVGFTTTNAPMQSMYITTKVVSPNIPLMASCTRYNIMWYIFSPGTPVSSTNKTDRHDISGVKHDNSNSLFQ
jgi:hypothetical protein